MDTIEFKSSSTRGTAKKQAVDHLTKSGYKRVGQEDPTGEFWSHPSGKKVYVTHRKTGRSYIDVNESTFIKNKIKAMILENSEMEYAIGLIQRRSENMKPKLSDKLPDWEHGYDNHEKFVNPKTGKLTPEGAALGPDHPKVKGAKERILQQGRLFKL